MSNENANNSGQPIDPSASRQEARDNIFMSAELMFEDARESMTVRIRNISSGGMMIDCSANFPIGHVVSCTIKNVGEVKGRIAWSVAPRMGIAFESELDPKKVRYTPERPPENIFAPLYRTEALDTKLRRPGLTRP
jgi:PilZ domain